MKKEFNKSRLSKILLYTIVFFSCFCFWLFCFAFVKSDINVMGWEKVDRFGVLLFSMSSAIIVSLCIDIN